MKNQLSSGRTFWRSSSFVPEHLGHFAILRSVPDEGNVAAELAAVAAHSEAEVVPVAASVVAEVVAFVAGSFVVVGVVEHAFAGTVFAVFDTAAVPAAESHSLALEQEQVRATALGPCLEEEQAPASPH